MISRALTATNALLISIALTVSSVSSVETATPSKDTKTKKENKNKFESGADLRSSNCGNFFSNPAGSQTKLPHYRTDVKPAEKIRAFIQAGTPELDQVRLIGSLKGKQRDEVIKAYETGRAELQPLNAEFNQLRKTLSLSLTERMLSKEEPQMDMMTKSQDFELLVKARGMLQKLRSKRLSLWEEIQAKLSPTQLDELDKLKSGQVPAEYMDTPDATEKNKIKTSVDAKTETKAETKIETMK
jgi:hypothetical protein